MSQGSGAAVQSNGASVLGRPFSNVVTGMEVRARGVPARRACRRRPGTPGKPFLGRGSEPPQEIVQRQTGADFGLLGGRYLELDEGLTVNEISTVLPTVPILGGLESFASDRFGTATGCTWPRPASKASGTMAAVDEWPGQAGCGVGQ